MIVNPNPNPRSVEARLAPRFQALLRLYPLHEGELRTDERAEALLTDALHWKASDIHWEPGEEETRVRFRIDGLLYDVAVLPNEMAGHFVSYFKTLSGIDATALSNPDHGHAIVGAAGTRLELRTTAAPTPKGEMMGIRLVDTGRSVLTLEELGLGEAEEKRLRQWPLSMQGLLLVCGPVGSGKTTTLYSLLHQLQKMPRSIVTVEDPVERLLDGVTQIEVNERRGMTFAEGIRAMLRLDPDFLLVGEIRDPASAHVAVTAAGSGLAVLSSIHARDAVGAVAALRNHGAQNWEISNALEMCVAQRLIRRLCRQCRISAAPSKEERQWFRAAGMAPPASLWQPSGCDSCAGTGFEGRVGVFEVWQQDELSRKLILQNADHALLRQHAVEHGMVPLSHDLAAKTGAGLVAWPGHHLSGAHGMEMFPSGAAGANGTSSASAAGGNR